jgi:hypothetical protein
MWRGKRHAGKPTEMSKHRSPTEASSDTEPRRRARLLGALIVCLLIGCVDDESGEPLRAGICDEEGGGDPYSSSDPEIRANKLHLSVGYSGGCDQHEFAPCWNHSFDRDSGLLVAAVWVGHDAHGDTCEEAISTSVELDLVEIADAWRSETGLGSGELLVRVTLHHWEGAEPPTEEETIDWVLE